MGRQLGMVTISYDEKPGIQGLAVSTPDRPPVPGRYPGHLRDYEYERTVSLLAGLDLHSGRIVETVSDTHKGADFTPTHGSWLTLIENQFSKITRTMLRGIRVTSKPGTN